MSQGIAVTHPAHTSNKIWKVLSRILFGVIILLVVGYLGISAYAANAFTTPERNFNPELNPGKYGLDYEDVSFPARGDGLNIAAWYIPSAENQRVIILVHGYNNSRTNGFLDEFVPFAAKLHEAGFSVMLIDLRGHGQSGDARFTFGVKERQDVLGAVDWLEQRGYQPGKIGVLGYSLGAGSIIGAAAEEADIGAVWVDSLFADIRSVLEPGLTAISGLPRPFYYSTVAMIRLLFGFDITASRPIDDIARIAPRPIFMAHCEKDNLIPIVHMQRLLEVAQNTQTWVIPECNIHNLSSAPPDFPEAFNNHAIGYPLNRDEYLQKVTQFFDQNLD